MTYPIPDLAPGDVVYLPIHPDGTTQGPITVEWVREEQDGTTYVGWHAGGEDHVLCLPLDLAALGADLSAPAPCRCRGRRAPRGPPSRLRQLHDSGSCHDNRRAYTSTEGGHRGSGEAAEP